MYDNHLSAGAPPWVPLGRLQRSADPLDGVEGPASPLRKIATPILYLRVSGFGPRYIAANFFWHPSFFFLKTCLVADVVFDEDIKGVQVYIFV